MVSKSVWDGINDRKGPIQNRNGMESAIERDAYGDQNVAIRRPPGSVSRKETVPPSFQDMLPRR
jgi:hypothetical protein